MTQSRFKYLRPEDVRKLASYEFAPRALVEGYLAGRHKSLVQGASTVFRDYRPYVPGDDPRLVDWRVFARTDRHYLRTYDQETNTGCNIVLDSSASMGFGRPQSKLDYASFFAAALAYLVIRRGDRASLTTFAEGLRAHIPAGSTGLHLNHLMHALESNRPGARTNLAATLLKIAPLLPRRGVLVIISDFLDDPPAIAGALNLYIHRGFSVYMFQVLTPEEIELEPRGLTAFLDMETGKRVVAHTANIQDAYRAAMRAHIDTLRRVAIRRRIDFTLARTDAHYFHLFDRLTQ